MYKYYCDWCKTEYELKNKKSIGGHRTHCKNNPRRKEIDKTFLKVVNNEERNKKISQHNIKLANYQTFTQECPKCGTEFELTETEHNYKNGKYRKYCSRKCANSRKMSNEVKKKIKKGINKYYNNEVIHKKYTKKKYYCKYCSMETQYKRISCNSCLKWHQNIILFKKLGVYKDNIKLEIISKKALDLLFDEYFNNKLSTTDLLKKYNIRENTTFYFFKKHGIDLRNLSEATSLNFEIGKIQLSTNSNFTYSKCGWHTTWDGKQVYLRSSYEFDYALKLDKAEILYEVEKLKIKYYDTQKKIERISIPDFYLIKENKIVEIKSLYTLNIQNMKDRVKAYKKNGYDFDLIVDKEKYMLP